MNHWQKKMSNNDFYQTDWLKTFRTLGILLCAVLVVGSLTGCATEKIVVREKCTYPMPPDNLMQQPQSLKWIRPELLPLPSSK